VLTTFTERAGGNIADALKELQKKHKPKQVILDLRDNGGGLLIEAVNICNLFVKKDQEIVSIRSKIKEWDRPFSTRENPIDLNIPLIVLINENSASASEIVAGAIQDLDRGILLGRKSFGKGLVQNVYDIGYNSKVKLTTARYYIPSGRCIQALDYRDGKGVLKTDTTSRQLLTKNGRKINDGGGLSPDVFVLSNDNSAVLKSLQNNKVIFDYANLYQAEHDSIQSAEKFQLTEAEFEDFLKYIKRPEIKFPIEAEKELDSCIAVAKSEGSFNLLKNSFDKLEKQLKNEKAKDLDKNRKLIKEALEEEIVLRFYYEKGKIQLRLKRDKDVQEAIKLFADEKRFKALLSAPTN
jgi:carboxyl-terminal processing protease